MNKMLKVVIWYAMTLFWRHGNMTWWIMYSNWWLSKFALISLCNQCTCYVVHCWLNFDNIVISSSLLASPFLLRVFANVLTRCLNDGLLWFAYVTVLSYHEDVIKWKHFLRYWPFVRGIHRSPVNSPHKGQWREALMFSLICAWMNGWVNNREAGDLRCHRAKYVGTVMIHNPKEAFRGTLTGAFLDKPSLSHWGRDKITAISQTTFSTAVSGMKMLEFPLNLTEACS